MSIRRRIAEREPAEVRLEADMVFAGGGWTFEVVDGVVSDGCGWWMVDGEWLIVDVDGGWWMIGLEGSRSRLLRLLWTCSRES